MRGSSNAMWLLLGLAVIALFASRLGRSLGAVGIIVTVVLIVIIAGVALELVRSRSRPNGPSRWRTTKNVTPHEPALEPGPEPPPGSVGAGSAPTVIVVDTPDGTDRLATRLQALDRLRADGLVTDEEYESKRAKLIADF